MCSFHYGPETRLHTSFFLQSQPNAFLVESKHDENISKRHGRAILTDEQAQAIFRHKPSAFAHDRDKAGVLAKIYGVSIKTVRDVWVGRTWYRATFHMDHTKPFAPERLEKKAGRPKGAKDSKPRSRKAHSDGLDFLRVENRLESSDQACYEACKQRASESGSDNAILASAKAAAHENIDSRSWKDFPMAIPSGGFEDPFREDWEIALQNNEHIVESDSCDDWSGEDRSIGVGQHFTADDSASDYESPCWDHRCE
jgi:hypothetical protein